MTQAAARNISEMFSLLDSWEDRYRYLIELGRTLPRLGDSEKTEANKIHGCVSRVWLVFGSEQLGDGIVMTCRGESDAMIVQGLLAVVLAVYSGRPASNIVKTDALTLLDDLGLLEHLTKQRTNGLSAIVDRICAEARSCSTRSLAGGPVT